jgi:lysophospholipase L1-like esterase
VADCGIAGEVSPNGLGQVRDYLGLFPDARYYVIGYGSNDLDKWPDVEATSPRIVENLDRMVGAVRAGGRTAVLLGVPNPDWPALPVEEAEALRHSLGFHNDRLRGYCRAQRVPLVELWGKLGAGQFEDSFHPNDEGAQFIAEAVLRVLTEVLRDRSPG